MKSRDESRARPERRSTNTIGKNFTRGGRMLGAALLLMSATSGHAADGPNLDRWDDWILDANGVSAGDPVRSRVLSKLSNRVNKNLFLVFGSREYGINLDWARTTGYNIRVERIGSVPDLRTGDPVAIYVDRGGYPHYEERDYGINLRLRSITSHEWEIRSQNNPGNGRPIKDGERLGLYNLIRKDFLVYCDREYGINLRWFSDCDARLRSELRVERISTDPSEPRVSTGGVATPMKLKWWECNSGAPTSGHTTVVSFGAREYAKPVSKLRRNECRPLSITVDIPYIAPGDDMVLRVSVDSELQYRENDEKNNVGTKTVRIRL